MKIRTTLRLSGSALFLLCASLLPLLVGCKLPGKPADGPEVPRPEEVADFDALYGANCAGCHGAKGEWGASMNLSNPEYQALVDDARLRDVIANGETGTLMPAFGIKHGGMLTAAQIDALVTGMRTHWSKGNVLAGQNAPTYKAVHEGDVAKGQAVYTSVCAKCHERQPDKGGYAGSILDGSFLALINEQTIRTTVIAGRPDLGMPDWRGLVKGRTLTDDEITDVTAWLMAQKPALPGQPYASPVKSQTAPQPPQAGK